MPQSVAGLGSHTYDVVWRLKGGGSDPAIDPGIFFCALLQAWAVHVAGPLPIVSVYALFGQ